MSGLSLNNIAKSFGPVNALDDINLDIKSGEFICLLGGSGCGKTTLLRIIAGLEVQTSGGLSIDDSDMSTVPCHQRNIGMVFQSLALFPHLSVADNIGYGLDIRGIDKPERQQKINHLLTIVGLDDLGQRPVSALSGGQKQRVAIARALAIEPALFLMDEPFSALDAGLREHLQVEVKKLQRQLGVTTIFVTHDQKEAMSIADRIVILNQGRIEQADTPMEIYTKPQTRFVAEFMGNNNLLDIDVVNDEVTLVGLKGVSLGKLTPNLGALSGRHLLSVRPEYLKLSAPQADTPGLVATVNFVRPLGASVETELVAGDFRFLHVMTSDRLPEFETGDSVAIHVDLNHAWPIPS